MAEHKYNVKFLGLRDGLSETRHKFLQNMPQLFKVTQDQIEKIIVKAPVTIAKNLDLEKAQLIGRRIESIGGIIKIEIDRQVTLQNSENAEEKTSHFESNINIHIDEIKSEIAKHNMAKYLNKIINDDYLSIKFKMLNKLPTKLPGNYSYEQAKRIKNKLEEFGSKVLINQSDTTDSKKSWNIWLRKKQITVILMVIIAVTIIIILGVSKLKEEKLLHTVVTQEPFRKDTPREEAPVGDLESSSAGVRGTEWRMSKKQVKKIEKTKFLAEEIEYLCYKTEMAGLDSHLYFGFNHRNELYSIRHIFEEEHSNRNMHIEDFMQINKILRKKYGEPDIDRVMWRSNLYRDDRESWGFAISRGDLGFFTMWKGETSIMHSLSGDNYQIYHILDYHSLELKKEYDEFKEKETLKKDF